MLDSQLTGAEFLTIAGSSQLAGTGFLAVVAGGPQLAGTEFLTVAAGFQLLGIGLLRVETSFQGLGNKDPVLSKPYVPTGLVLPHSDISFSGKLTNISALKGNVTRSGWI